MRPTAIGIEGLRWTTVFTGAAVFDGARLHAGAALVVEDGRVAAIVPRGRGAGRAAGAARRRACWRRASSTCRSTAAAG